MFFSSSRFFSHGVLGFCWFVGVYSCVFSSLPGTKYFAEGVLSMLRSCLDDEVFKTIPFKPSSYHEPPPKKKQHCDWFCPAKRLKRKQLIILNGLKHVFFLSEGKNSLVGKSWKTRTCTRWPAEGPLADARDEGRIQKPPVEPQRAQKHGRRQPWDEEKMS